MEVPVNFDVSKICDMSTTSSIVRPGLGSKHVSPLINNMSKKKSIHRISKRDLLSLLNKHDIEILRCVNRSDFGFVMFLEERRYTEEEDKDQILEIVIEILNRVCSVGSRNRSAPLDRFLRMLKDCQRLLFDDVPRLIYSCVTEKRGISLVQFMSNYMNILKTVLRKDFFPNEKILNEIFPTLENYMNRLRARKCVNLDKAEECFKSLRREVEWHEDPPLQDDDDEENLNIKNFRLLSIVPRSNDIVNCEIYSIPQNIVDGPYKNVDHFLSVHYRLTREDMLRAFRDCVKMYISPQRHRISELTKINYFENVSVGYPPEYSNEGIVYDVKFTTSKEIDWSKKGLLTPGSLVFLTPDLCNSVVFATVYSNPRVDYSKSKECRLKVKLEDDMYKDELLKDTRYAMIEPSAFFECYKHVLSAIKEFSEATFPLSDIISYLEFDDPVPEYLHDKQYCLHEKCDDAGERNDECSCKVFNPLKDDEWPTSNDLKLDEQQYEAFKVALTKKVAVIQGPPGTGKTFIGLKVVKSLLRNVPHKPIVICCLTNHALDQFLERMLDFTKKVVRLGSQSKSEVIEPYKIQNMIYALRQYHLQSVDEKVKESFDLVKKIAPVVLSQKADERELEPEFYQVRELSRSINRNLELYVLCEDKYLEEDSALNAIIGKKYKKELCTVSGSVSKSLSASMLEWLMCCRSSDLYNKCRKMFSEFKKREINCSSHVEELWVLTERKRYELFYCWRKQCMDVIKKNLETLTEEYKDIMRRSKFKNVDSTKLEIMRGADIIGVTTTGAGKYKDLLQFTAPRIIVIEEAAQVLESHVVASLVRSIQHLILIGDHEQLRPLPADNELSEKYNLKVSMFERLFQNGAPSATLVMQHRMRPCIAELLVPRPYKEYTSYENVYNYEEIKGVGSSVFFFDHRAREDENSSGVSSSNDFEARMIVALAKYFTVSQYSFSQITILATYAAQTAFILKYIMKERLVGIHVTTVDNFQGEENDIILLSFVRSNPSAIGFLKESNRVCVALSRARKGMFCFGNFQFFADKNDLWNDIVQKLRVKNMIGEALPLKCFRHDSVHLVKSANDILEFRGCSEECNFVLPCKHICSRKCHLEDADHSRYLCKQPCEKMMDETYVCPRLCFEKCQSPAWKSVQPPCGHSSSRIDSICLEEIPKRLPCIHLVTVPCHVDIEHYQCKALESINLHCGHKKSVWCYQRTETKNVICSDFQLQVGPCGHTVEVPCGMSVDEDDLLSFCNKACDSLLDCGHPCIHPCRVCSDSGIHGFCVEKCELFLTCGHKCGGYCGSPCPPCSQRCFLSCGHLTFCINDCLRPCVKCEDPCERKCNHKKCSRLCWEDCSVDPCTEPCSERLPCGHKCVGLCGDPCPSLCRDCDPDSFSDTGNNLYVELECEHVVEVDDLDEHISVCLLSLEWPSCPRCSSPITRSLRYKEKLKQAKRICIESCDTSEENSKVLYLVETMHGKTFVVPARFLPIHRKIVRILKKENPRADMLMVLKNCVMLLKKLVNVASEFDSRNYDEYIQGKFDTLMLWISRHLTRASFQQLRELETAVTQLSGDIACRSLLRLRNKDYFSSI